MANKPHPIFGTLDISSSNPHLKQGLTFDKQGKIFRWENANPIVAEGTENVYKNWDEFNTYAEKLGLPVVDEIFKKLFGHPIPKKMGLTNATVAMYAKYASTAEDRVSPVDPNTGRKSNIGTRVYTVLWDGKTAPALKTPQAMACLKIVHEEAKLAPANIPGTKETDEKIETLQITEADLKAKVIVRQAELKTRQDPWRIFQYYRPQLIAAKLIKHN